MFVIGGTGFVGSHLCGLLASESVEVVAYDMNPKLSPALANLPEKVKRRITIVRGSVTDLAHMLQTAKKHQVEGIIHPAVLLPPASEEAPVETLQVNVLGLTHSCEVARILDLRRLVYLSSQGVYGVTRDLEPVSEEVLPNPTAGMYQLTKYMGELVGAQYSLQYGLDFIAIRTSMVFGPGQSFIYPLNHIVAHAIKKIPLNWPDGDDHPLDYTYVEDLAWGIKLAYEAERHRHTVYNLSGGRLVTNHEIRRLVCDMFPEAKIRIGPGLLSNPPIYKKILSGPLKLNRAREDFGFNHKHGFEGGLRKYINFLQHNPQELERMLWHG